MSDSSYRIDGASPASADSGECASAKYVKLIDNGDGTYSIASASTNMLPKAKAEHSITATTTSQTAVEANATRARLLIKNLDAAITVFVNLGAVATTGSGSISISPGGFLELEGTNQALNVIAASGTPVVTIWEF